MFRAPLVLSIVAALAATPIVSNAKRTVCTITVNSTDERDTFRKHLPDKEFQFVELVERGRKDWLASACKQQVKCDVLVISGHFNGKDFFSDQLAVDEHLPVAEMERASCSESCSGVFSRLKDVYMFGCDSLNGDRIQSVSSEISRTLVNGGQPKAEADRIAQSLVDRHAESNRDVMRRVFVNTPAIYGFSSVAPLGIVAGRILNRHLNTTPDSEVGSGRHNRRLLSHFAQHSMTVVDGLRSQEPRATHRAEVCRFVDDRLDAAQKLAFIHAILKREPAQMRMFFDRIERYLATLTDADRDSPAVRDALAAIVNDATARDRYLAFARNTEMASSRVRMTDVAHKLGWLSDDAHRAASVRIILDLTAATRHVGAADVDQLCRLNRDGRFDDQLSMIDVGPAPSAAHRAALACLGSPQDRTHMLAALTSTNERNIEVAEVYFAHRPIVDGELRIVAAGIANLPKGDAQVRALHALARQPVSDGEGLQELAKLYPVAESASVQRAIASVLIRSDHRAIATPELVRVFREHRLATSVNDVIDVLIRRLERAVSIAGAQASR
ncbi:MAG TPA: hypothetical protein VNE58_12665 [Casimicrobiaceae bacterium]|nr:hypothetical protein [Casimicrobiaceae bacterium]